MCETADTPGHTIAQTVARRRDVSGIVELAQHRLQSLIHVGDDTIQQEILGAQPQRTRLPRPQQSAVEQNRCGIGGLSHAAWYAEDQGSGNRA